jgi:hypothetical protein
MGWLASTLDEDELLGYVQQINILPHLFPSVHAKCDILQGVSVAQGLHVDRAERSPAPAFREPIFGSWLVLYEQEIPPCIIVDRRDSASRNLNLRTGECLPFTTKGPNIRSRPFDATDACRCLDTRSVLRRMPGIQSDSAALLARLADRTTFNQCEAD